MNRKVSEHSHQVSLMRWAKLHERKWPELKWLHAIPNGGQRNVRVAVKLKSEGVKRGIPDVCLPVAKKGYHGLYIELKAVGGRATKEQSEFIAFALDQNYHAGVYHGWEAAKESIEWYLS